MLSHGLRAEHDHMCPPLVVTKEEADVALDILEECIQ
jgi:4-aminobutyrate aminotransferase-like enzyme